LTDENEPKRELLIETVRGVYRMRVSVSKKSIRFSGSVTNLTTGRRSLLGPPPGLISAGQLREAYQLEIEREDGRY
jgi:hypothetical protein